MKPPLSGIHHITALASDPQRNVDFYTNVLGLRLVKKTVNFDAPDVYHLYFGDTIGRPGTIVTFFPFIRAAPGIRGAGEVAAVAYSAPISSVDFWIDRLSAMGIPLEGPSRRFGEDVIMFPDPDGMMIELVFQNGVERRDPWKDGAVPVEHALGGLHGATFWLRDPDPTAQLLVDTMGVSRFQQTEARERFRIGSAAIDLVAKPNLATGRQSAGSVHHIAWRVELEEGQRDWQRAITQKNLNVTEILDRQYFRSVYFREPGGILFEIATDLPGFTVDETESQLGSTLKLPPWLEQHRVNIEKRLPHLEIRKRNPLSNSEVFPTKKE